MCRFYVAKFPAAIAEPSFFFKIMIFTSLLIGSTLFVFMHKVISPHCCSFANFLALN